MGSGRLGQAIASSTIFAEHRVNIAAVFDVDPDKVGRTVDGTVVSDYGKVKETVREKNIIVSVLAVPPRTLSRRPTTWSARHEDPLQPLRGRLDVPQDVAVHTSNPAVNLLYALYFHLT